MLQKYSSDSIVAGICTNCADYVDDCMEPDAENYYCEDCETGTVQSALILAGVI